MKDLKRPSLDDIMYEIKGICELINGLRLGMVKRSVKDDFTTVEDAMKDVDRHHYIDFLKRKILDLYKSAKDYGDVTVYDETALMRIDKDYVNTLRRELEITPKGSLHSAILRELMRTIRKLSIYACYLR